LGAFQAAIDYGVGGIELDVQLSKDNALMVFHDTTLERMAGVPSELASLTLAELKNLRLFSPDKRASKHTIPTLDQVLDLVERNRSSSANWPFVVNIELKDPQSAKGVAAVVAQRLAKGWQLTNFLISSFHMSCLREFKTLVPEAPLGVLFECAPDELAGHLGEVADLRPSTVNITFTSLTPSTLSLIESVGAKAVVWTPNETDPSHLSQSDREQIVQRLREGRFVAITDFPKEILSLLRPNKARATVTGVLVACLALSEQDMLFRPTESGLEILKSPSDYPELKRFGFSEVQLTAGDGVVFTVWERNGYRDRPHFLLFHGNRAHWGDTGPGDPPRDRRARLKFIEELATAGAGVTAVTLRGFGKSNGKPSEQGFLLDISAVADHLNARGINHRNLVVAGESLGTWAATQAAVHLTKCGYPPALLSLQNPFVCMAEVGEQVVSQFQIVRSLNIALSASALDRHVLKNHFYTGKLVGGLSSSTTIHIATSGKDDLIDPSHSARLAQMAENVGLKVICDTYPEALHHNIPPVEFARRLVTVGVSCCRSTSNNLPLWSEGASAIGVSDHVPYL